MEGTSELRIIKYKVNKTLFCLNEGFEFTNDKINIEPSFSREVNKIDKNRYVIKLGINISKETNNNPIPFDAEVIISAIFEFSNWEEESNKKIAINNSTAILFPYLRTLLATITLNGNVPPYTIPVMNIAKMFDQKTDNE